MTSIFHALEQIPVTSIAVVFAILLGVIALSSNNQKKDMMRFLKGVILTILLSMVTFCSVLVLKYLSYLKIDVMQLGVYETLFFAAVFGYVVFSRSLSDGKGIFRVSIPYPVKQVVLFFLAFIYVLAADTGLELYWVVVGILPLNVLYHLHYIRILDKVFSWMLKLNEKFEEKFMVSD
ncbi:MAG: hypothetical protein ABIG84_00610 [archaeon]